MKFNTRVLLLGLLLSNANAFAGEELVGKSFWVGGIWFSKSGVGAHMTKTKGGRADDEGYRLRKALKLDQLGKPVKVKITGYDPNRYEVEMPSGEKYWVDDALIDRSLEVGALLTYDPVAKQEEQEVKQKEQAAAEARKAKVAAAKRAAERISQIKAKGWPANIEKSVLDGRIQIGMTSEQATLAWGKPEQINKTVGSWGVHEQWVYHSGNHLYFENGILTSWQTSHRQ
jgi:hypothetical protein